MAARLLIALVSTLALLGGGYWWGASATDNAWTAKAAKAKEATEAAFKKETERADTAAGHYLQEHLDQEVRYAALDANYENLRRRVPLVVSRPVVADARCDASGAAPPQALLSDESATTAFGSPDLTYAAVRMWNGALTSVDAPAGACGLAGAAAQADAACAETSGLTVEDAWSNHAANARACADDRQRYQHLIDFLN